MKLHDIGLLLLLHKSTVTVREYSRIDTQTDRQTHRPSTVTLAAYARRGLITCQYIASCLLCGGGKREEKVARWSTT